MSTNYLGLAGHPTVRRELGRVSTEWPCSLSTPRLLGADGITVRLENEIAALTNCPSALILPSTTHAALDILPLLAGRRGALFVDEWAYPTSVQGSQLAAVHGAALHGFRHDDCRVLEQLLATYDSVAVKVIVCDGVYVDTGAAAALKPIVSLAQRHGAVVYVDDAHGIGVLGEGPTRASPYGHGGRGTPSFAGVPTDDVIHVGTLSKAFGVPLAFVAGTAGLIELLKAEASSVVHSSPPDIPSVGAGLAALMVNLSAGDRLRQILADRVRRFRHGLRSAGLTPGSAGLFPIQTLLFRTPASAVEAGFELRRKGIWALVQLSTRRSPANAALRFAISALHSQEDIEEAVAAIAAACQASLRGPYAGARTRHGKGALVAA